jgi:hypothetical protein
VFDQAKSNGAKGDGFDQLERRELLRPNSIYASVEKGLNGFKADS